MKVKLNIYKLHFNTPLHLGDDRDDYSVSLKTIHSDTLYAALTAVLAKVGERIPPNGDLGFTISSLFPFYQKNASAKAILFFPKSRKQFLPDSEHLDIAKQIKRIAWLDKSYFEKHLNGLNIFNSSFEEQNMHGEYLSKVPICADFIHTQIFPRVMVPRSGDNDTKPFYMDRLFFKDYSGLFFIVHGENVELLEFALSVLQHEGIGTDRNVGNGFFTYTSDNIEIDLPESEYCMTLSMFCPESAKQTSLMLKGQKVAYNFIKRGGWITSSSHNTYRKNSIYMFEESSVLKSGKTKNPFVSGKIVNLIPEIDFNKLDHPVWRSGRAIFIPLLTE